jgi:sugar-phosphatase
LDPEILECQAILFDLDGVMVDSSRCVELVWREWGRQCGRDPAPFIAVAHGRRTSETIALVAPELNAEAEAAVLDRMEEECTEGLVPVPGVLELVRSIPPGRWGLVTSAHRPVAVLRLTAVGIPLPSVMITGDVVTRGKPDPEPYLTGAVRMGVHPSQCLAFEDAPPGVASARGAGLRVVGLRTTHQDSALSAADVLVDDFRSVAVQPEGRGLRVRLTHH